MTGVGMATGWNAYVKVNHRFDVKTQKITTYKQRVAKLAVELPRITSIGSQRSMII